MMENQQPRHNYTGQTPSDVPSEALIHPPKRKNSKKKADRKSDFNTTAKDPNLGNRNSTGR